MLCTANLIAIANQKLDSAYVVVSTSEYLLNNSALVLRDDVLAAPR